MNTKVTVQDIADALNLSRTTVSKVLNHSPAVSDATRAIVLGKAKELGYHAWNQPKAAPVEKVSTSDVSHFALVMHAISGGIHMGSVVLPSMDQKLRQAGVSLITCTVSDGDLQTMQLPPILSYSQTKAIVCLEMYHPEYSRLVCTLGKPVLFIDACTDFYRMGLDADLLLMENRYSVNEMLTSVIRRNKVRTMGFLGSIDHRLSFRERYEAFLLTAVQQQVETAPYCIMGEDSCCANPDWVQMRLEQLPRLPQLFFCANDYLAEVLIHSLEAMGKRVPEDVMVCGFDGQPSISKPQCQLTTVATPSDQLGASAASILLRKLSYKDDSNSTTYLKTRILYRKTTI